MLRKTLSIAIAAIVLQSLFGVELAYASPKSDRQARLAAKLRRGVFELGVGEEARISLKLVDGAKLAGYIREATDDSFVVVDAKTGAETTVAYGQVAQARRHNLSPGKTVIVGVAFVLGLTALCALLLRGD